MLALHFSVALSNILWRGLKKSSMEIAHSICSWHIEIKGLKVMNQTFHDVRDREKRGDHGFLVRLIT